MDNEMRDHFEKRERDLEARVKALEDALLPFCLLCEPTDFQSSGETHVSRMVKVRDVQTARNVRGWNS